MVWLDLSVENARLLNLAPDRISGEWDDELLARLVAELSEDDSLDLSLSGFDDEELTRLVRSLRPRTAKRNQRSSTSSAFSRKRERPGVFSPATCGSSGATASTAATRRRLRTSMRSWPAGSRTSLLPTRHTASRR